MNTLTASNDFFTELAERWQALLRDNNTLRIRNAAEELGVSEAELLSTRTGQGVVRLQGDFKQLIARAESLGTVMALTRNDGMVHEKTGQYKDVSIHGNMGLALGVIDLRIFFTRFNHGFAVEETGEHGVRHSLQFFAANGEAVHKIYATDDTNMEAFNELVQNFRAADQTPGLTLDAELIDKQKPADYLAVPANLDTQQLRHDWSELKDVHHFQAMLNKHGIERIPAYERIGADYAQRLDNDAFEAALTLAAEAQLPVMIFVGSTGVVQIHTGTIRKLLRTGPWFNILDPGFNLHANTTLIDQVWLVRKPTTDGVVSSLEMFDRKGQQLALLFGERKPGKPELDGWRELLNQLLARYVRAV